MITRTITRPSLEPSSPDEVVAEVQTPEQTGRGRGGDKAEAIAAAEANLDLKRKAGIADASASENQGREGQYA